MKFVKQWWAAQMADLRGVVPQYRWDQNNQVLFVNSEAGLLRFRPKNIQDLHEFRNIHLNRIESTIGLDKGKRRKELFKLYHELRKIKGVKVKSNLKTKMQAVVWNLISF